MLMASYQSLIGLLIHSGSLELHAITLCKALNLSMTNHRETGQSREQRADTKVFVSRAELIDCCALIRVAHEVDVTFQNVGIELDRFLKIGSVFRILFIAQHVHERAVVHAMHT